MVNIIWEEVKCDVDGFERAQILKLKKKLVLTHKNIKLLNYAIGDERAVWRFNYLKTKI